MKELSTNYETLIKITGAISATIDPEEAVRLIDAHGCTHVSDFPPVLASLLDAADLLRYDSVEQITAELDQQDAALQNPRAEAPAAAPAAWPWSILPAAILPLGRTMTASMPALAA